MAKEMIAMLLAGGQGSRLYALTGFDDDEDRMLYPFFSTVHVDTKWLGRRMVHEFLWREEHPEAPKERILVSGEVVVRRSSCKRQG